MRVIRARTTPKMWRTIHAATLMAMAGERGLAATSNTIDEREEAAKRLIDELDL